jgi:hypothetical protein
MMEKDGNCLFRCFSKCTLRSQEKHKELREQIASALLEEDFVEASERANYSQDMGKLGTWGGNIEISQFSLIYQVNVHVFSIETKSGNNCKKFHLQNFI